MSPRTTGVGFTLVLGVGLLAAAPSVEPVAAAEITLAQLDARERALRQEFTRQRYERERRRREQAWRDYRERLREQQRAQDARRRDSIRTRDCAGQAARVRESLDRARDSARSGAGDGADPAEDRLSAMRRSGCDPLELRRLEQELSDTRKALDAGGE